MRQNSLPRGALAPFAKLVLSRVEVFVAEVLGLSFKNGRA
jgi:hypothetical protein